MLALYLSLCVILCEKASVLFPYLLYCHKHVGMKGNNLVDIVHDKLGLGCSGSTPRGFIHARFNLLGQHVGAWTIRLSLVQHTRLT